jgi:hypothetical protein
MTRHPYGRRRSESQRGVEGIYVLTLFLLASSFFVLFGLFTIPLAAMMPQAKIGLFTAT